MNNATHAPLTTRDRIAQRAFHPIVVIQMAPAGSLRIPNDISTTQGSNSRAIREWTTPAHPQQCRAGFSKHFTHRSVDRIGPVQTNGLGEAVSVQEVDVLAIRRPPGFATFEQCFVRADQWWAR